MLNRFIRRAQGPTRNLAGRRIVADETCTLRGNGDDWLCGNCLKPTCRAVGHCCRGKHAPVQPSPVRRRTTGRWRCLRGEDTAWQTMFRLYHPQLVSIIKCLMHNESGIEQAEEIAAAVWSSLCSEAYTRLRQYDPRAGRLLVYLASMARKEIWRGRRARSGTAMLANARSPQGGHPGRDRPWGSKSRNSWPP